MQNDDAMNAVKYFDSVALHMCLPDKLGNLILTSYTFANHNYNEGSK